MSKFIIHLLIAFSVAACTSGGVSLGMGLGGMLGNHVGLGTSINIPLSSSTSTAKSTSDGEINVIEQKIITYFDTQGTPSDAAIKGGYYRQLLGKNDSDFLVQDFYATGEKRTDPMQLERDALFIFWAHPKNGTYTVYAINGAVMQQLTYQQNRVIKN